MKELERISQTDQSTWPKELKTQITLDLTADLKKLIQKHLNQLYNSSK